MAEFPDFGVRNFGSHPQSKALLHFPEGSPLFLGWLCCGRQGWECWEQGPGAPLVCFAIPFSQPQRERRYFYKTNHPRSVSPVQCPLESHLLPSGGLCMV